MSSTEAEPHDPGRQPERPDQVLEPALVAVLARDRVAREQRDGAVAHERGLRHRAHEHVLALPVAHPAEQRDHEPVGGEPERLAGGAALDRLRARGKPVVEQRRASAPSRELPRHRAGDAGEARPRPAAAGA